MKTELDPTYRPTGDSRQSARFGTHRVARDVVALTVGRFGISTRPRAQPTNPIVA